MIKKGDLVTVYVDPITCEKIEFVGKVKTVEEYWHEELLLCSVYDNRDKCYYQRKININHH